MQHHTAARCFRYLLSPTADAGIFREPPQGQLPATRRQRHHAHTPVCRVDVAFHDYGFNARQQMRA